ncbi:MAG: hypothetical protein CL862_14710 [Cyanobium sp. NAT70]|nr:hypothetical protein [Cyanobium sp. NAT70]
MDALNSIHHYLVRYKNLQGKILEKTVYASDATKAQQLAFDFNAELKQRPHLIKAILRLV